MLTPCHFHLYFVMLVFFVLFSCSCDSFNIVCIQLFSLSVTLKWRKGVYMNFFVTIRSCIVSMDKFVYCYKLSSKETTESIPHTTPNRKC